MRTRLNTSGTTAALVIGAALVATAGSGAGYVLASYSGVTSNGTILTCMSTSTYALRVVDHPACRAGETVLSWNQKGPQGVPGTTGPAGPTGATGPAGAPGLNGIDGAPGKDGDPGTNGSNGVSGWEVVSSGSVAFTTGGDAFAACPTGKSVLGGGYVIVPTSSPAFATRSYPDTTNNGWSVRAENANGNGGSVSAYAVCALMN